MFAGDGVEDLRQGCEQRWGKAGQHGTHTSVYALAAVMLRRCDARLEEELGASVWENDTRYKQVFSPAQIL